jgi:hypothetical protein
VSSGPLSVSDNICFDGSPGTSNPSSLSSNVKGATNEPQSEMNSPKNSVPNIITHTTTQNDLEVANHDCTNNMHQHCSEKIIVIKSGIEFPIPDIIERKQLPAESQEIPQTSNTGKRNTNLISNRSRTVSLSRRQCACFPYFKYLGCGKN